MRTTLKWCAGILWVAGLSAQAAVVWDDGFDPPTTVWSNDFSGALNPNLALVEVYPATVTQIGNQLVLDSGGVPGGTAGVSTTTDESGTNSTFNGAPLYDFYDHEVSTRFNIASMAGAPDGADNRNTFYYFVGDADGSDAVSFLLEHLDVGGDLWRIVWQERIGGGIAENVVATLDGQPTALVFTLNGTNVSIQVEGAAVTATAPGWEGMAGSLADVSAGVATYSINFGVYNLNVPTSATVVTLDSFVSGVSAGGFNPNWTVRANGAGAGVSQAGGQMIMDVGVVDGTAEGSVSTLTDETGTINSLDGAPLYDFYSHKISARFDIANITGQPDGPNNRNSFFFSVGDDGQGLYFPKALDNGIGITLEQLDLNDGNGPYWRLVAVTMNSGAETVELIANLSGLPAALTYSLDGINTTIEIDGATVTDRSGWDLINGDTKLLGTMADLSVNVSDYTMAFGAYVDGVAVAEKTVVYLDAFMATVFAKSFATWADGWGVNIGSESNDYDGDLLDNLSEYALGGDPTNSADRGFVPTFGNDSGTMVYVYAQRTDDQNLAYHLETNGNLILGGNWVNGGYTELGTDVTGGLFDFVSNSIPTTANETFIRLRVQNN